MSPGFSKVLLGAQSCTGPSGAGASNGELSGHVATPPTAWPACRNGGPLLRGPPLHACVYFSGQRDVPTTFMPACAMERHGEAQRKGKVGAASQPWVALPAEAAGSSARLWEGQESPNAMHPSLVP